MLLTAGSRVGSYEIVSPLGAGGMGEVYVARDSRLGRNVAIKLLPAASTADPDRRARLEREARVLAALNHPNIAAIYGVEDIPGGLALVLELAVGQTLEDRLRAGPLPVRDAIAVARQIADALDAAHERGIIHRDLKPANITLSPAGAVKVLDFGLAVAAVAPSTAYEAPTQQQISLPGMVVGTPAYMSPEQARGQAVDRRTDIWAFGCVLFAMLTGRAPFGGETVTDTLAAVLEREPAWRDLPLAAAPFARVLQRCLEKDLARRLRDIGDVKLMLEDAGDHAPATTVPRFTSRMFGLTVAALVVLGFTVAAWWSARPARTPARVARFELAAPAGAPLATMAGGVAAISPDATRIVYAVSRNGSSQLMLRDLNRLEAIPIAGTEGAYDPFFSPDGRNIGFSTLTALKRVPTDGGPVTNISPVNAGFHGAVWSPDNTIVFAQDGGAGLFRVGASGGVPEKIAVPDPAQGEENYFEPAILPGGQGVLYTIVLAGGHTRVARRLLVGGGATTVIEGGFGALYLPSGHLAFGQGDRLMAVRYDLGAGQVVGSPVTIQENAFTKPLEGVSNLSTAADGTAVYVGGHNTEDVRRLVWIDRRGTRLAPAVAQPLEGVRNPRISPDGKRIAATLGTSGRGNIWIFDVAGAAQPLKLTFKDHNTFPVWSPDGKQIAFLSVNASGAHIFSVAADGSALEPQQLTRGASAEVPLAWSPDSASILFYGPQSRLWLLQMSDRSTTQWLPNHFTEFGGAFSPDGQWIAYGSNQTGRLEIWVRPFGGAGAAVRISSDGGHDPVWTRDGREILYTNGPQLMSARVMADARGLGAEPPRVVLESGFIHDDSDPNLRFFDAASDGRLLVIEPVEKLGAAIVVVQHWGDELNGLRPGR